MQKTGPHTAFDVTAIRKDFPILRREVNGKPLVYFDNAATSQTPQQVIDLRKLLMRMSLREKKYKRILMPQKPMRLFLLQELPMVLIL